MSLKHSSIYIIIMSDIQINKGNKMETQSELITNIDMAIPTITRDLEPLRNKILNTYNMIKLRKAEALMETASQILDDIN